MKISGTNKELVEIINLLDPSFKCKCNPNGSRFRCDSKHNSNCLFEEELPEEYGIYIRSYDVDYDGNKIINAIYMGTLYPNGNILNGTVR